MSDEENTDNVYITFQIQVIRRASCAEQTVLIEKLIGIPPQNTLNIISDTI